MTVKAKIKHLKPGTVFNAGPVAVRVLEHFPDGKTLVITDECIAGRFFTCQPFKPNRPEDWKPNNWRTSTLRADLNRDFLNSFDEAGGPILSENIIPAEWDLTDSAGNNAYGSVTDKIGLLTEAMFRKYSEQGLLDLVDLDDWWWLITPSAGSSYDARLVSTDGTLYNYYAYYGSGGVRPALYVESEIEVELEEDEIDLSPSALLEGFTTRQLVEELFRRIGTESVAMAFSSVKETNDVMLSDESTAKFEIELVNKQVQKIKQAKKDCQTHYGKQLGCGTCKALQLCMWIDELVDTIEAMRKHIEA